MCGRAIAWQSSRIAWQSIRVAEQSHVLSCAVRRDGVTWQAGWIVDNRLWKRTLAPHARTLTRTQQRQHRAKPISA